jgi:hypothetical protein
VANSMPPITDYYRIVLQSNGTGGPFQITILVRREDAYSGDGSEMGPGLVSGDRQLLRLAKGIANGLERAGKPSWDAITVVSIDGNETRQRSIPLPADPVVP